MNFDDIKGHDLIKRQLQLQLAEGRVPHAQLFCGPAGVGKLPMALAFASALLCRQRTGGDPCGHCNDCHMSRTFAHPDLHFVMPAVKQKTDESDTTQRHLPQFLAQLQETPWFTTTQWQQRLDIGNKQPIIYENQIDELVGDLSLVAQKQGGYKVVIVWQADRMNESAANKLLKTLEEPTPRTVIMLLTERPEMLLETIRSRTQMLQFSALGQVELEQMLIERNGLSAADARQTAHAANGSYTQACALLQADSEHHEFFDIFVELMRKCYVRDIKHLHALAQQLAGWNREQLKRFMQYCQRSVRENFIFNLGTPELNYQTRDEAAFSQNFARFINEKNVEDLTREFSDAERDIEHNGHVTTVLFDLFLKLIVLLIQSQR